MRKIIKLAVLPVILSVSGCATITRGTTQDVSFNSDPPGAYCEAFREGKLLYVIGTTPQTANIKKSSESLTLVCNKEGYAEARHIVDSETELMTAGNVVFGGLIGLAIDAGSGAMNKYDANVVVRMTPEDPTKPVTPTASTKSVPSS